MSMVFKILTIGTPYLTHGVSLVSSSSDLNSTLVVISNMLLYMLYCYIRLMYLLHLWLPCFMEYNVISNFIGPPSHYIFVADFVELHASLHPDSSLQNIIFWPNDTPTPQTRGIRCTPPHSPPYSPPQGRHFNGVNTPNRGDHRWPPRGNVPEHTQWNWQAEIAQQQ